MEQSPLTQSPRPEVFQQKIVRLYEELFKVGLLLLLSRQIPESLIVILCSLKMQVDIG